jgi:tRNA dimethylallyltransferase
MTDGRLAVICGPTGAGKSAIALALAERHGATIISADSRQVYRRFDIGTAKPTRDERALVPHHGIDVVDPTERYSAAQFAASADTWIVEARAAGRTPIVVGGTGFFIRALIDPLFVEPPIDETRRDELARFLETLSVDELRSWVEHLDPSRAELGRTQLLRSIEIALLTGQRLSDLHASAARPPRHQARYLVVDPGAALAGHIERRVDAMLGGGWLDEVAVLARDVPPDAPAWKSSGYRTVRHLLAGEIDADTARRNIIIETRQYAKRQRTWFRHQLDDAVTTRIDPHDPGSRDVIEHWWTGGATA